MCTCNTCVPGAREELKRVLYSLELEFEVLVNHYEGGWEPNPDPLQEHKILSLLLPRSPRAWITVMRHHAWQEQRGL